MDMQNETDRYAETQQEVNAAIQQANLDLKNGNITQAEHDAIISESTAKLNENSEAHKRWAAETVFAFAQARAAADGNISQGEGEILIAVGKQLGLFDEQTATAMQSVNSAFSTLDASNAEDVISAVQDALNELAGTYIVNIETRVSGDVIPEGQQIYDSYQDYLYGNNGGRASGRGEVDMSGAQPIQIINYGNITMPDTVNSRNVAELFG
jgi:hypothetical protein